MTQTVVNISSKTLKESETDVLSLGLNFAPRRRQIPVNEIIASTEITAKTLDQESAQTHNFDLQYS